MSETTSNKKQRLDNGVDEDVVASFTSLSTDILANIFGHLPLKEIMRVRRVCKKTIDAVKETSVPLESNKYRCFRIDSIEMYNALVVMAEVLPGLQQIRVDGPSYSSKRQGGDFRYPDGEDPIESTAAGDDVTILNLDEVLSKFPNLHSLDIDRGAPLNGKYPSLFNFSHLESLSISSCDKIKFDFGMLAGLPSLKEFECERNKLVTGNLKDLSVRKDTLETITLHGTFSGTLTDLADFPHLKRLDLMHAKGISGSLLDIDADNDDLFPVIEKLRLPDTVVGGHRYEVMHIAQGKQLIKDLLPLRRKRPGLFKDDRNKEVYWQLSRESPDILDPNQDPEFQFRQYSFFFVEAGDDSQYLGWRWEQKWDYTPDHPLEVTWFGHVPKKVTKHFVPSGMGRFYKGYYEPPPANVYNRLQRSYRPSAQEMAIFENL